MKRKLIIVLLALIASLCLAFGLAACSDSKSTGNTEHIHDMQYVAAQEATCTEAGNIEYWYCVDCGEYFSDEEATTQITKADTVTAALAHDLTTHAGQAATCIESGWAEYVTCSNCDYTTYTEIQATGHTEGEAVTENEVAATCTEDGSYELVVYCTVCNTELSRETKTVEATGHSYSEWESLNDTVHQGKCEVCEDTETAAHYFDNDICTACGYTLVYTHGLKFTLSGDKTYYTVSGIGTATETDIVIPSTYNNLPVASIGSCAFMSCTSITSVTIGSSVSSIGSFAFYLCTSITRITIPDSVTSIGSSAFRNCTSLTRITIPNSVTSIGGSAFYNCTSLTSVTIGNSVTSIGSYAFWGCDSLTSVTIGSGVTSIGSYAFSWCDSLESVVIGNGVTYIGSSAFYYCISLESVYYGCTAKEWGDITISSGNGYLTSATIYYYSEEKPMEDGNYWHYDEDGMTIVIWGSDED